MPLSASGSAPVTHYAARTQLEQATHDALTTMTTTQFKAYVDEMQVLRGRTAVGSVTAFKGSVQISALGADPWAYLTSLGLKRVA